MALSGTGMVLITVLVVVPIGVTDPFAALATLRFTTQATGAEHAAAWAARCAVPLNRTGLALLTEPGPATVANTSATPDTTPTPYLIMASPPASTANLTSAHRYRNGARIDIDERLRQW